MDAASLTHSWPYQEMNDYLRLYPEREAQMRETLNYFAKAVSAQFDGEVFDGPILEANEFVGDEIRISDVVELVVDFDDLPGDRRRPIDRIQKARTGDKTDIVPAAKETAEAAIKEV